MQYLLIVDLRKRMRTEHIHFLSYLIFPGHVVGLLADDDALEITVLSLELRRHYKELLALRLRHLETGSYVQ